MAGLVTQTAIRYGTTSVTAGMEDSLAVLLAYTKVFATLT